MQQHVDRIPKRDPAAVAQLIARVAEDPNPRLRYLIGTDARIQMFLKRLLPWKWHERIVARALKLD